MTMTLRCLRTTLSLTTISAAVLLAPQTSEAAKVRIGQAGILTVEKLVDLVALEYAKKRGFDYEMKILKSDDVATQAILSDEIDVVMGSNAYRLIQKLNVPARHFFQLRVLAYYPVVSKQHFKSWKDLDGQEIAVHGRGSGTEVFARQMEAAHGIKFRTLSYVPGANVRANALLRGTVKAAYLNIPSLQYVMKHAEGKFTVLPSGSDVASDAALFAKKAFLEKNASSLQIFVEELLRVVRRTNADPAYIVAERERLKLMPNLPKDQADGLLDFFKVAVDTGLYPNSGGDVAAVKTDFTFYSKSGDLTGDPKDLKVEDYWDMTLLDAAKKAVGGAAMKK